MLATLIYCGLPLVSARREHIVIDTFDPFFSRALQARARRDRRDPLRGRVRRHRLVLIFQRAQRVASYGDTTSVLKLPLAPFAYMSRAMIVDHRADPPLR